MLFEQIIALVQTHPHGMRASEIFSALDPSVTTKAASYALHRLVELGKLRNVGGAQKQARYAIVIAEDVSELVQAMAQWHRPQPPQLDER